MTTEEYNKCVDNYSDSVYRFILKNLRDEDKAKNVVQDTFENVDKSRKHFILKSQIVSFFSSLPHNDRHDKER